MVAWWLLAWSSWQRRLRSGLHARLELTLMSFGKVRRKKAWGGREKEEHVLFLLVSRKSNCELCFLVWVVIKKCGSHLLLKPSFYTWHCFITSLAFSNLIHNSLFPLNKKCFQLNSINNHLLITIHLLIEFGILHMKA
jgi:hypothetical protein